MNLYAETRGRPGYSSKTLHLIFWERGAHWPENLPFFHSIMLHYWHVQPFLAFMWVLGICTQILLLSHQALLLSHLPSPTIISYFLNHHVFLYCDQLNSVHITDVFPVCGFSLANFYKFPLPNHSTLLSSYGMNPKITYNGMLGVKGQCWGSNLDLTHAIPGLYLTLLRLNVLVVRTRNHILLIQWILPTKLKESLIFVE